MVFTCGVALGQQFSGAYLPPNASPTQLQGVQTTVPAPGNHWQRDAMQMIPPPTQMSAAAASQWSPPNRETPDSSFSPMNPSAYPVQANVPVQPIAGQMPPQVPSYLPPVHVSPPSSNQAPGRFGYDPAQGAPESPGFPTAGPSPAQFAKKSGPLAEFRNTQLSDRSLIHRGPGLQDRLSELATRVSSKAFDSRAQESNPQPDPEQIPSMTRPEFAEVQPPLPFAMRVPRSVRPIEEAPQSPQPIADRTSFGPRTNRVNDRRPRDGAASQNVVRQPVRQNYEIQNSGLPIEEPVADQQVNQLAEYQDDNEVAQATMSEPVLSEPLQDPFGDYRPLRADPTSSYQSQRMARVQDNNQQPISVLNRPVRHRNDSPNRAYLPSNRSVESYSEPDPGEPAHESEPHVLYRDDSGLTDSNEYDYSQPENEPFYEFAPDGQDALDANLDQLEELPSGSGEDDQKSKQGGNGDTPLSPVKRSCDEFRSRLLNNPITDISLDMSPPRNEQKKPVPMPSRTWTDRGGNILATGSMTMLSRGYVVLDTGQKISRARLSDADVLAITENWQIPEECSLGNEIFANRCWIPQTVTWKASALCHKTLFFENVQLERYGHSHGPFLQPIASTGHFFASLFFLPYQSGIHPANECQYALGYYRPGDCAPWLKDPVPISLEGAKLQTLTMLGFAYIP
jgi:hypothetical protein